MYQQPQDENGSGKAQHMDNHKYIVKDCMKIFLPREYPDMLSKRLFQLPPPVYFTWHYFHLKFVCMCRAKSYFKWIMSFLVFASRQRDTISTARKWSETYDPIVESDMLWPCPGEERRPGAGEGVSPALAKQVKKRMTLSSAVKKFKSRIGTASGAPQHGGGGGRR